MDAIQLVLDQIPIKHDIVSQFIFLGVFQGFFVASIIIFKANKSIISLKLIGYFLIAFCLVLFDQYLCYTGLMKYTIYLNDTSEPLVLLWAPLLYLFIRNVLEKERLRFRTTWYHFLLPLAYALSQIGYYAHPRSVKINAYIAAYFPDMKHLHTPKNLDYGYQLIKDEFRWILLLSGLVYTFLCLRVLLKKGPTSKPKKRKGGMDTYRFSRNVLVPFILLMLIAFIIFLNHENDLGDHYIGMVQAAIVFMISIMVFSESRFFQKSWVVDKYEALKAQNDSLKIEEIKAFMQRNDYFAKPDISLKELSSSLGSNVNHVSKVINLETGNNFNEFINSYRIELAKRKLLSSEYGQLTIEAIGNSVGFKSKSAFYNAFKHFTGVSPKVFRENMKMS